MLILPIQAMPVVYEGWPTRKKKFSRRVHERARNCV